MIRVWDVEKGKTASGPFEGHTDDVLSVAFSPDGKYVVSGSMDETIHVWDAEQGNTVSGLLRGTPI
jgi:WD40 repeat protein